MTTLTEREQVIARIAFAQGYEQGNDDAVEGRYGASEDIAADWVPDAMADGVFDEVAPEGAPGWNCLSDAQKDEAIRKATECVS